MTTPPEAGAGDTMASGPAGRPTAAAVIIATEVLTAKVQDENTPYLARVLRDHGVRLSRVVVIEDAIDAIATEVRYAAAHFTQVFTSGGIGPTHDDLTFAGVAAAFGRKVVLHPDLAREIEAIPEGPRRTAALRLATLPEGAELVRAPNLRWPIIRVENVWIFPGVPSLFRQKLDAMIELVRGPPIYAAVVYCTVSEGEIVAQIDGVVAAHPAVEIGSYPLFTLADYKTKLTIDGASAEVVADTIQAFEAALPPGSIIRVDR